MLWKKYFSQKERIVSFFFFLLEKEERGKCDIVVCAVFLIMSFDGVQTCESSYYPEFHAPRHAQASTKQPCLVVVHLAPLQLYSDPWMFLELDQ